MYVKSSLQVKRLKSTSDNSHVTSGFKLLKQLFFYLVNVDVRCHQMVEASLPKITSSSETIVMDYFNARYTSLGDVKTNITGKVFVKYVRDNNVSIQL